MIYLFAAVLAVMLLVLAVIDIREFRLPNVLTIPLIGLGLLYSYLMADFSAALIGAVAGYLAFVLVEVSFKRLRGIDGLGRGDAKLLAVGGAWCGWLWLPQVVLIASLSAIIIVLLMRWRDKTITSQSAVPFGPFLAMGIVLVWGVQNFHERLF